MEAVPGEEMVALCDDQGRVVGSAPRSVMRARNLRHAATGILVTNSAGEVYVHRRTDTKDVYPGHHDFAAVGVVAAVETPLVCAERELAEELGISGVPLVPAGRPTTPTTTSASTPGSTRSPGTDRSATSPARWRGATGSRVTRWPG